MPDQALGDGPSRLRSGPDVAIVNLSGCGVLLETGGRVLPGARVEVVLPSLPGWSAAAGRVVRAWVSRIDPDEGVRYRAAVAFDHEFGADREIVHE